MDSVDDVLNSYALSLKLEMMKRGVLSAFDTVAATEVPSSAKATLRGVEPPRAAGGSPRKMEHPTPTARDGKRERRKPTYVPDDPLLTAAEAAIERRQALSTFWRDVADEVVPSAYYISPRCPRWRLSEIRASVDARRARSKGRRKLDG